MTIQNNKDPKVFDLYKTFRNYLRKFDLNSSLLGLHAHSQFQQFHEPIPQYIKGFPMSYRYFSKFLDFASYGLYPWQIALLTKEIIINAQNIGGMKSMVDWHSFSTALNKLKYVEDQVSALYITDSNLLLEINRIVHNQTWQISPSMGFLGRYWHIYNQTELKELIDKQIGISLYEIFIIGFAFIGLYQDKIALNYPPIIQLPNITNEKLNKFIAKFAIDLEILKQLLIEGEQFNDKYTYSYNSLISYPIIKMMYGGKDSLVCPIPRFLFERFTTGLYYELFNVPLFDNIFGASFQNYIGDALKFVFAKEQIFAEEKFNKLQNRTIDWILADDSGSLFIECKTKRLRFGAKIEISDLTELENELEKMAEIIIQGYKTISHYEQNKYPHYPYNEKRKIYFLIVTLENWFLFGDKIFDKLEVKLAKKMKLLSIPSSMRDKYPYTVCSADVFEILIQVIKSNTIDTVLSEKVNSKEYFLWEMLTFLQNKFREDLKLTKELFKEEFDQTIDKYIYNK